MIDVMADRAFRIATDRGPIDVSVDYGSGDSVIVSVSGAVSAKDFDGYDANLDCLWAWNVSPWEAAAGVARLAQTKGLKPTCIELVTEYR